MVMGGGLTKALHSVFRPRDLCHTTTEAPSLQAELKTTQEPRVCSVQNFCPKMLALRQFWQILAVILVVL